jgi:hypothetical protein
MSDFLTAYSHDIPPDKIEYAVGILPKRQNTVVADVLAMLLEGHELKPMDSVFAHSTTRLSAVIHDLEKKYGWDIERRYVFAYTQDGREVWTIAYKLPQDVAVAAHVMGAGPWVAGVKLARTKRKIDAIKAKAAGKHLRGNDPRMPWVWGDL